MKGSTILIGAELVSWHSFLIGVPLFFGKHNGITANSIVLIGSMYCFMILYIYNQWLWLRRDEEDARTCDDPPRTGSTE